MKQDLKKTLGPLIALHRIRPLCWKDVLPWLILGLFGVFLPLFYGVSRFRYGYTNFGPAAANQWSRPWYLLTILALIIFVLLVIYHLRFGNRYVAVHQKGLNLSLSQSAIYRWEQLAGISISIEQPQFLNFQLRRRYFAIIYPNVGKPIHLDDTIQEFPELLTQIKARLYPRLIRDLKVSFESGQWVYFGPVSVNRQTFRVKKYTLSWNEVKQLKIDRGALVVELENQGQLSLPVSQIPNLEILLQLIHLGAAT